MRFCAILSVFPIGCFRESIHGIIIVLDILWSLFILS